MSRRFPLLRSLPAALLLLLAPLPLPARQAPAAAETKLLVEQRDPLPGVRTGGAPADPAALRALAAEGFRTYVELRAPSEVTPEFRAAVAEAGLELVELTITGEADLDLAKARALDAILDEPGRRPAIVACASGNRSGALLAVRAFWLEGAMPEEALALGKAAGLTRLEPSVRLLLGLPAPSPTP